MSASGNGFQRANAGETVARILSPAVRFNSDFLNLPPCTAEQREVAMSSGSRNMPGKRLKRMRAGH